MRELIWLHPYQDFYLPTAPGLSKMSVMQRWLNDTNSIHVLSVIDNEAELAFYVQHMLDSAPAWLKSAHRCYWLSRFTPQAVEGKRLMAFMRVLCPLIPAITWRRLMSDDAMYVMTNEYSYPVDTAKAFSNQGRCYGD